MHNEAKNIAPDTTAERPLRVLIAAGGTGGHVYPAIAIADALKKQAPKVMIKFVGTKTHMEWQAVPRAGYEIESIWISGFHRRWTLQNLLFPAKLATSLVQSMRIIASFKPDAMICCGGYAAGPVGWVAAKKKVMLFIQEQNSFPGVTNRLLAKHAALIFTAFKETEQQFPPEKTRLAGNPTRDELTRVNESEAHKHFNFSTAKQTLLVLGGSGGARAINEAMIENLSKLHKELDLQIIWQCGEHYSREIRQAVNEDDFARLRLVDFLHDMPEAYAVADLVVSRAGALSCSEIARTGNAAILVPSPNVAGDHQTKNAQSMVEDGAAEMVPDKDLEKILPKLVKKLFDDQHRLKEMQKAALKLARPDAAKEIAKEILERINQ